MTTQNPMNPEFQVHKLNEKGIAKAQEIAEVFNDTLNKLNILCLFSGSAGEFPEFSLSREFSIVRTKLEEACFFAKKAMANNPANQIIPEPIPVPEQPDAERT